MALTAVQRLAMSGEGLSNVNDFADFKKEELKIAIKNVRTGIPAIPGTPAIAAQIDAQGAIIQAAVPAVPGVPGIPPVLIPAKSISRLQIASIAYHYYIDTGREVNPQNMHFNNVLKDFYVEWQALDTMSDQDAPKLPTLSKTNTPLKWCESFKHYLYATFGVRKIPLSYVIRSSADVTPEAGNDPNATYDPLQPGKAYGTSGSVLGDLIARADHNHPLFKSDNATVYGAIEEATRGSIYTTTIKPFSRGKNGRGAWLALLTSHVGNDKWEKIQKDNQAWLISAKWNGKKYALDSFISQHRSKYQQLEEASQHVQFQVPNEHTRVGYLIDSIDNADAALQAAIASVRQNSNDTRDNFEKAAAILLPVDPFEKTVAGKKSISFNVSALGASNQFGRGETTGVDLRWYKADEYAKLSAQEKIELNAWQKSDSGKKAISAARKEFYSSKRKNKENGDNSTTKKSKTAKKAEKQTAKIAGLEKELKDFKAKDHEETTAAEIAAILKSSSSSKTKSPSDESMSLARQVMAIVARKKE